MKAHDFRVDRWLDRKFQPGPHGYNCFAFARDVWVELTGVDLGQQTPEHRSAALYQDRALQVANTLQPLEKPASPCLVLLLGARTEPHVGVYYRNKILHLNEKGVYYQPLSDIQGNREARFYK